MPETEMPANTATAPRRGYKRQGPSPPGASATPVSPCTRLAVLLETQQGASSASGQAA